MKVYFRNNVRRFQEGGAVAGGEDPMQQILQGAVQAVQNNDADMALQVCQMLVQIVQQQGGGAEEEPAPEMGAPEGAEGEPVYRAGGRLVRRVRK